MWQFKSPFIVFGEDALCYLDNVQARHFFVVTDVNMVRLGLVAQVAEHLQAPYTVFDGVEPEPSLQTVRAAASRMHETEPDWIVGLGGGSCMDAAKAAWLLYERPDAEVSAINPLEAYGVRAKARLIAIPTTSGTGSETTMATVLTDTEERRKLALGSYELVPDIAIVDPALVMKLPQVVTADTGMDVLTHAVEGYTSRMANDFTDGLCLKAVELVNKWLPRAYADGSDEEARMHMHNAATIAGLGFGNSQAALAHAMGHSLGALHKIAHGRAVSLFLPYAIEFTVREGGTRYGDLARRLDLAASDEASAAALLAERIRELERSLGMPTTLKQLGIGEDELVESLPRLVANANMDTQLVMNTRVPSNAELEQLYQYAYAGKSIDFLNPMDSVVQRLLQSPDPALRYHANVNVLGGKPNTVKMRQLQRAIAESPRVRSLLGGRNRQGEIPQHPYSKWTGAHWVLYTLAEIDYPPHTGELFVPLRDRVLSWLLSPTYERFALRRVRGQREVRIHASMEGNALWSILKLDLDDGRAERLAARLLETQWRDGGWNCDLRGRGETSSFTESLIPLRALALYARTHKDRAAQSAVDRAAEFFLKRRLYRRVHGGTVIHSNFVRLRFPDYWHYDILFGLKVMAEAGLVRDPRCGDALDVLESKQLPRGGWAADGKYYHVSTREQRNGTSRVAWGPSGKTQVNEFVTADALYVLRAAGRFKP